MFYVKEPLSNKSIGHIQSLIAMYGHNVLSNAGYSNADLIQKDGHTATFRILNQEPERPCDFYLVDTISSCYIPRNRVMVAILGFKMQNELQPIMWCPHLNGEMPDGDFEWGNVEENPDVLTLDKFLEWKPEYKEVSRKVITDPAMADFAVRVLTSNFGVLKRQAETMAAEFISSHREELDWNKVESEHNLKILFWWAGRK